MRLIRLTFAAIVFSVAGLSQSGSKPEPDVLIFTDGEKLIGHLKRSNGASVTFKSDMAGEVTVEWSKIKELHSSQRFAVIRKDMKVRKHLDPSTIPQGALSMTDQKLEVKPGGRALLIIPVGDAANVIDASDFQKDIGHPGFFEDWKGAITGGVSLVESTQKSRTFNSGLHFVRAIPTADWLEPRNRTIVDFGAAYGKVIQPGVEDVKTEIYHFGAERDQYLSPRGFGFGQLSYDHNFSQGLSLQQNYGGGFGWVAFKEDDQELDLKASTTYIRQSFQQSKNNQSLIGATVAQSYYRKFSHGILFVEQLAFTPAFNNTNGYSAFGNAGLTIPFYKQLNFSTGIVDNFLNDPPPGFKKNSFQFTTGVTYTLP
jgi:Protein of unknown function, DUF481